MREEGRPMEKSILEQYIDACAIAEDVEKEIQKLEKKKKTIVQTNVSGSNPEFPYNPQHFKVQGTIFTYEDDLKLRQEERILKQRQENAEALKIQVQEWLNTIPMRMQRIIDYKIFKKLTWEETAQEIGRGATGDSVRMEYNNFMKK